MLTPDQKNALNGIALESSDVYATQKALALLSDADAIARIEAYLAAGKTYWHNRVSVLTATKTELAASEVVNTSLLASASAILTSITNLIAPPPV